MRKIIQCVQHENANVSLKDTIYAIKNAGFDGVFIQWYNRDWDFSQRKQLKLCRELNLEIPFFHLGYNNSLNSIWEEGNLGDTTIKSFMKDLDFCKENKIDLVVMHLGCGSYLNLTTKGLERIQKLVDYAEKLGIKIAFENRSQYGEIDYVLDHIKNENAGICFDAGHYHCYFKDKFNWQKFKNKIFAIHLHDNFDSTDQHLLPFDGTNNWKEIIKNLKNLNYDGPITLESCYRYDYLKLSLDDFYKISFDRAKEIQKLME